MAILMLIMAGLVIWLDWYLATQFCNAAQMKGHYEKKYFWLSFLLGPVGYLLVVALPDRGKPDAYLNDDLPSL